MKQWNKNPVHWELELTFDTSEQYFKFMKYFMKYEKSGTYSLPTPFQVSWEDQDKINVTIYLTWGGRLKEIAKLVDKVEGD